MVPVADYNLFDYYSIAAKDSDKLSLLRSFFGCLASALAYIHDIKIRHRDIKPQNVLVKGDRVFLTDFGIALDWEQLSRSTTTADSGKTWPYAAPEVARYEKRNTSSDVWSLGCVFLEMVTVLKGSTVGDMRHFFKERSDNYRFYANIANLPAWKEKLWNTGAPKDDKPLIWVEQMLQETAELRPTAAKLYEDIAAESAAFHIPFCGPCCNEEEDSPGFGEEEDDDEMWGYEGEPSLEQLHLA
jgi:serine/threonine protein kinase